MSGTRTIEIDLPANLARIIDEAVERGTHVDAADYLRDLLRREADDAERMRRLDELIREGLESGPAVELDMEAFIRQLRAKHDARENA